MRTWRGRRGSARGGRRARLCHIEATRLPSCTGSGAFALFGRPRRCAHSRCPLPSRPHPPQVLIRPCSKVIVKFLQVMMKHGYIGEFEIIDDHRAGKIVVNLIGRVNKCGVISPRFDIKLPNIEKWTANLLPSRQFGFIVLTTSSGIMDHEEARRKHTGGKILGFFY